MQAILDYIGSVVIGGMILISILEFYGTVQDTALSATMEAVVQENLLSITDLLEYDLLKTGYGIDDSVKVARADSNQIVLRGDFDDNGVPDSVMYRVSEQSHKTQGKYTLSRKLNTEPARVISTGISTFRLSYFDANGNGVTGSSRADLARIRSIKVAVGITNYIDYDGKRSGAYWERVVKPKNLR